MPVYRCAYCHKKLGQQPQPHCPHCGRVMLLPKDAYPKSQKQKHKSEEEILPRSLPNFRPGKNPTILGSIILVFIILGSLLTSQFQTQPETPTVEDDPIARTWREIDALTAALERFQKDTGRFPTEKEGLVALVRNLDVEGWNGHYVNLIQPDPWRTPYRYSITETGIEVRSAGPDRTFETKTDIVSTIPTEP